MTRSSSASQPQVAAAAIDIRRVRAAASEGRLAWRLSEPEELEALLGEPSSRHTENDGGLQVLVLHYAGVSATFKKMRDSQAPFTLYELLVRRAGETGAVDTSEGDLEGIDIGHGEILALRCEADLEKLDSFWGLANVSLANLDLRDHGDRIASLPFDSRTEWPPAERLPAGFDPARRLEDGKDPGLGVRRLHEEGIDGRGVHIAIIDQPLNRDHREFAGRLVSYEEIGCEGASIQMHGAPVASIAVGRSCGVAPAARLSYFAVPMWKSDNAPCCDALQAVFQRNSEREPEDRIRIVSISTGMFSKWADYTRWQETFEHAGEQGILVLTCAQERIRHGMLARQPGKPTDEASSYQPGRYGVVADAVLVPAGHRTTASHEGPDVYTYWIAGGLSWATPYLAGVAALAWQVDPALTDADIVALIREAATRTDAGLIINPPGVIAAVRQRRSP